MTSLTPSIVQATTPLPLPAAGFGAGKAYDVVLKFTSTQITPQATISPWEEAGDRIEVIL